MEQILVRFKNYDRGGCFNYLKKYVGATSMSEMDGFGWCHVEVPNALRAKDFLIRQDNIERVMISHAMERRTE